MQRDLSTEQHLAELGEAARRAGAIVTEQINSIVEGAEAHAERILADAHSDAERTRRDALDSAQRLLEHLHALERPLGRLVANLQEEVDRVSGELESGGYVDAHATAIGGPPPSMPEVSAEPAEPVEPEQPVEPPPPEQPVEPPPPEQPVEPPPPEQPVEAEEPTETQPPEPPPAAGVLTAEPMPAPPLPTRRRGLFRRLRRSRGGSFISIQGYCAVCQRAFMAGSEENLELSGWRVTGDVGLCPECQSEGWQLPEGARLPFRRGGG